MPTSKYIDVGVNIHVTEWSGDKQPFVLVHGLSSNKETWRFAAEELAAKGHHVLTVDQRGHGLSDKPDSSYSFDEVTDDLRKLIDIAEIDKPIMAGQSWGGNVMLSFGARFPGVAAGLVFVDGGFLDLKARPGATWEKVSEELRPPEMNGLTRAHLHQYIKQSHPDWSDAGVEATVANLEEQSDGTLKRRLPIEKHMLILRAMWDQNPSSLYGLVHEPVLIIVAEDLRNPEFTERKRRSVNAAQEGVKSVDIHWFEADHDIHVQKPDLVASLMLNWYDSSIG